MSVEVIESEIATLGDAELRRLQAFILSLRHKRDPEWRAEMARRIDDQTPGRWMSLDEAERELDARRAAKGE